MRSPPHTAGKRSNNLSFNDFLINILKKLCKRLIVNKSLNRRKFLGLAGMGLTASIFPHISKGLSKDRKPNFIIIFCNGIGYADIGYFGAKGYETTNVSNKYPDVIKHLQTLAEKAREDFGDKFTNRKGKGLREL
jgi:hypothetical protein